jgi:hypothetical protein
LVVVWVGRVDGDAVDFYFIVGGIFFKEFAIELFDLLSLLDCLVIRFDYVGGIEESLDGVLIDEDTLGVAEFVVKGE